MEIASLIQFEKSPHNAVIVGVQSTNSSEHLQEELSELASLLKTLGITTVGRTIQRRTKLSPGYLIGSGKITEIIDILQKNKANLVIIDHPLSGPQSRNLEETIGCQVLDRSAVILDIFAQNAKSNAAKTQVEIAQLQYLLPRLTKAWTHFQRQKGGSVRGRGMGEQQIEIDRRRAREKIARLKKKLKQVDQERQTQRKLRHNVIQVSLVGYTNTGKTTIMQNLTRAQTPGADVLFATLDASVRILEPSTRPRILLSDTVGFIRKLPHSLIESFKSTLEEVCNSDLLLHIVDTSHPSYKDQMETTEKVLEEISADKIPRILIFNKMDQVQEEFLPRILKRKYRDSLAVSAHNMEDIKGLRSHIYEYLQKSFKQISLRVPANEQATISLIYQCCLIIDSDYENQDWVSFNIKAPEDVIAKLQRYQLENEDSNT